MKLYRVTLVATGRVFVRASNAEEAEEKALEQADDDSVNWEPSVDEVTEEEEEER